MKQLFVVWARYQRRPLTMRKHFGYDLVFLPPIIRNKFMKPIISYPVQVLKTICAIFRHQPDVLWVQAPPNFLLHVAWLARKFNKRPLKIVADLHNRALTPLWFRLPLTRKVLNSFDRILVHNQAVRRTALAKGITAERLQVLEDLTPYITPVANLERTTECPRFVMPCSFADDEPISTVIATAHELPKFEFYLTGDRSRVQASGLLENVPPNVTFTGFLDQEAYDGLVGRSTGVLCLTRYDGIQLSSAIEAIGAGKPLIISDTPLLRSLFEQGLFTDNSIDGLRIACCEAAANYAYYASRSLSMQRDSTRLTRWHEQAKSVKCALGTISSTNSD